MLRHWPRLAFALLIACAPAKSNDSQTPDAASSADAHSAGAADAGCVPTSPATEVCDDIDNDCNGHVDDLDDGEDGIFDCQSIAIFGTPGAVASSNFVAWLATQGSHVSRLQDTATPPP